MKRVNLFYELILKYIKM